ncbi:MAG: magnesium transporter [Ruminococcaceae bacterium]|nr:magnesium transporter [Oscillospiraceae bacterium]
MLENQENEKNEELDTDVERDYGSAILSIIRGDNDDSLLRELLQDYHDNDIASILDELTPEERERLFGVLGIDAMSDILPFADDAAEYIAEMDADEAADVIEQMEIDDAVETLEALDEETRNELLELIEEDVKEEIELIASYDDDEFGSAMTTNFISIERTKSIKGAMRALVSQAAENDNISTIFVTDEGVFYGAIDLKELIIARSSNSLEDLISLNFPFVYAKESISENIEKIIDYSEELIPVLDEEKKLIGAITTQDILDLATAELTEDYARFAALSSDEDISEPIFKSVKKRIPWLAILLFLGLIVSAVVGLFEGIVQELPLIVSFQSLILGMAGNVGTQSLAVTVRTLNAEEMNAKKTFKFIFKETRVAFLNGLIIGIGSVLIIGGYLCLRGTPASLAFTTAGCVALALCFAMMISGLTGAGIPMIFSKLGIDPAIASGPLITTMNDLVAVISYYGLAYILLLQLAF